MSTALTLAVSFTGHPEYPLVAAGGVLVVLGVATPGPGSALWWIRRWRGRG